MLKFDETDHGVGYSANISNRSEKLPVTHSNWEFHNISVTEFTMPCDPYYTQKTNVNQESIDEDAYDEIQLRTIQLIKSERI